jgi:chorismate mutase
MSDLPSLRQRIDSLDTTLVNLLNERARVSLDIGAAKRQLEAENSSGRLVLNLANPVDRSKRLMNS